MQLTIDYCLLIIVQDFREPGEQGAGDQDSRESGGKERWNIRSFNSAQDKHRTPIEGIGTGKECPMSKCKFVVNKNPRNP